MRLRRCGVIATTVLTTLCFAQSLFAQAQNQNQGGQNQGGQNQNQGIQAAGIVVDAKGVLSMQRFDASGAQTKARIEAARKSSDPNAWRKSELRKISLNRLEAAIAGKLAAGEKPTDEMRSLVGMTRVQYVFFYPDSNDIVIAGPAEPWAPDMAGRVRGVESGRPVLLLEDLVVALRAYSPRGKGASVIMCSIDPTKEGLANLQEFLRRVGRVNPNLPEGGLVRGLKDSLGMQVITIMGISPNTHFAQVLVEADYRMKLIGIGLEHPRTKIPSYVSIANARAIAQNALQRWYFVPNYECVRVSEDQLAMELIGDGVKLIGEDEFVARNGERVDGKGENPSSKKFTETFTAKYAELSAEIPVYAQLRNLIDLSVVAAFIQQQDYYGKAGWLMPVFSDESKLQVQTVHAPTRVESAVASYRKGNTLVTPIGGGVEIRAAMALKSGNLLRDEQGELNKRRGEIQANKLGDGQWWWD
jgi:hypothetical protein